MLSTPQDLRATLTVEFEELTAAMNDVLKSSQYFRDLSSILKMLRERMAELEQ